MKSKNKFNVELEMNTVTGYYQHIYNSSGFDITGQPPPTKTHACLLGDHWCWSNARQNPLMAIKYLLWKIKRKS